ncbi:hypothetical protein [Aurantimonas sp. Leaf443]|uniref:hypothetical protein n=1 Tax=Aurantimonas sp. Leaf443 TaxID=1736378 RepID=UPI000AE4840D|nr:hypothetical protein [Aurantimonas sp. Leaf443]
MRPTLACLLAALACLPACGMQRAVGVLPSTLDDLADRSAAARERPGETVPPPVR